MLTETISFRVTLQEKQEMDAYAQLNNKTLSATIKDLFLEKLADEFDLKRIAEYEANPGGKKYSTSEARKLLGI